MGGGAGLATRCYAKKVAAVEGDALMGVPVDSYFNVPASVREKTSKGLVKNTRHPLGILWKAVQGHFASVDASCKFYDQDLPIVSTTQCFDDLRVPP